MESGSSTQCVNSPTKRSIRRVALACIQCRSRKVRCDATQPACYRCQNDSKQCEYQKSRRGGRPRRPVQAPVLSIVEDLCSSASSETFETTTNRNSSGSEIAAGTTNNASNSFDYVMGYETTLPDGTRLTKIQVDHLLSQYFTYFHVSHPCVLPQWCLQIKATTEPAISDYLLPILLYIGSIFTQPVDSIRLADAAYKAIQAGRTCSTGPSPYFIQALMLYSIAVYWNDEPERGRELLDEAINGAYLLHMHQKEFASQNGFGDSVLEESWRRTWWQIHVTDINIAGSLHIYEGLSARLPITTELPCEEYLYEAGNIPTPTTLKQYDTREFSDIEFSSFAHLIGFTQGITRVLASRLLDEPASAKIACTNGDTMLTAWCSLLPASKRRIMRDDGSVDELMFKANILMHTYVVDFHRQLSNLKYSAVESVSRCAPPPPPGSNGSIRDEAHVHTAKVLFAIEKLSSLLTLPTRFSTHTPFIICMISNMTIAHLLACRYIFQGSELSLERDKIRLNMGVLKMLGELWPTGQREYKAMGIIAREVLALKEQEVQIPEETPILPLDAFDFNFGFDANWACDFFGNADNLFPTNPISC